MRMRRWTALAVAGAMAAVLAIPAGAQSVDVKPTQKVKRDKYVLTAEEIGERPDITNAYDAVKLLRAQFLKATRGKGGITGSYASGGYRPDVIGKPVGTRSGGSTGSGSGTGGSGGEPTPDAGLPSGSGGGEKTSEYGSASGGGSSTTAVLYIDEVKQTEIEEMRNVPVAAVVEIRYMTGNQAAGRYGAGHEGGAILLKTNRLGTRN